LLSMRGVFNLSILNHRARRCRASLLPAWVHAVIGVGWRRHCDAQKRCTNRAPTTQKARG
jgi:hypothetical protein